MFGLEDVELFKDIPNLELNIAFMLFSAVALLFNIAVRLELPQVLHHHTLIQFPQRTQRL